MPESDEPQRLFSNLHGQVVTFGIKPNLFVRSGGIARTTMSMAVNQGGTLMDRKIEFVAEDRTGISRNQRSSVFDDDAST